MVSGTGGDSVGQEMLVAAEQLAVAGWFFATAAPSDAVCLEAQLLGVPGLPVPQTSVLGSCFSIK